MSGLWLDTKANKVVSSAPEEGIQLVSPDAEASPQDEARVALVKASLAGDSAPKTVTTKGAK